MQSHHYFMVLNHVYFYTLIGLMDNAGILILPHRLHEDPTPTTVITGDPLGD